MSNWKVLSETAVTRRWRAAFLVEVQCFRGNAGAQTWVLGSDNASSLTVLLYNAVSILRKCWCAALESPSEGKPCHAFIWQMAAYSEELSKRGKVFWVSPPFYLIVASTVCYKKWSWHAQTLEMRHKHEPGMGRGVPAVFASTIGEDTPSKLSSLLKDSLFCLFCCVGEGDKSD